MDGQERSIVINDRLKWPNGLALDGEEDRLYWTDAGFDHIESSDLQGKNRKV